MSEPEFNDWDTKDAEDLEELEAHDEAVWAQADADYDRTQEEGLDND